MVSNALVSQPLRALVIGAGPTTLFAHLPVLARLRDEEAVVLAVVCDIDLNRAAVARQRFGFLEDCGEAPAALERPDIDVVYLFGTAQMHHEYGLAALRNGKHLFVEKPIAPSYLQACELAQAARATGSIAVGGLNRRFFRSFDVVRARAGKARWRFAEAVFHKPEFQNTPPFGARSWLSANGIHGLDALIFMMGGLPGHLTALAGETAAPAPSVFSALMRWPDGAQGVFLCNNNAGSRREEYVFHGAAETCSVSAGGLTIEKGNSTTTTALPMIGDGFDAEHRLFLQAIRSGAEPPHSIAAIAPSLFLAELIESGYSGPVELPRPRPAPNGSCPPAGEVTGNSGRSVLIVPSVELQPVLASWLPRFRLVSMEDVLRSTVPRPDIEAAVLGRGSPPLPPEVLAKLPNLRVVGVVALSLARHEPEALLERGVTLVNASAAYADTVADFALGLAILGRRRAFISHEVMRGGGWGIVARLPGVKGAMARTARKLRPALKAARLEGTFLALWRATEPTISRASGRTALARDLRGATVGLLGWGANGRAFAERLARAGARVLVYSEHAAREDILSSAATPVSLAEALAADIVSLHRGLSRSTRHFLGAAELAKLRPGTVLINLARGALIEPAALLARLKQGDIFACLDTFESEPLASDDPLRRLANVFLTSHIAGGSPDMHAAAAAEVVEKVVAYLAGDAPEHISAARLRTMT